MLLYFAKKFCVIGYSPSPSNDAVLIFLFQKIDEDKLFNLFSLYGNIVRIKLLHSKPDHALVEMSDGFQAELAVHFLKVWSPSHLRFAFLAYSLPLPAIHGDPYIIHGVCIKDSFRICCYYDFSSDKKGRWGNNLYTCSY